jgi:hypothetical protein
MHDVPESKQYSFYMYYDNMFLQYLFYDSWIINIFDASSTHFDNLYTFIGLDV